MSALYIMTTTPIEPAQWFDGGDLPEPVPAHSGVRWANDADVKALVPRGVSL